MGSQENQARPSQVENKPEPPKEMLQEKISSNEEKKEKITITNFVQKASHPVICLIIVIFKIAALLSFIFLAIILEKTSVVYLIVILLGAFDFWITKNIAGRTLVGLRWWNEVKPNGEEVWIFESKNEKNESTADKTVFWVCLYANAGGWLILFIYEVITLTPTWSIIALTMLVFSGTNLYGYFKCSREQQNKVTKLGSRLAVKAVKKGAEKGLESAKV